MIILESRDLIDGANNSPDFELQVFIRKCP